MRVRSPVVVNVVEAPSKDILVSAIEISPFTSSVVPASVVRVPDVKLSEVSLLRN